MIDSQVMLLVCTEIWYQRSLKVRSEGTPSAYSVNSKLSALPQLALNGVASG